VSFLKELELNQKLPGSLYREVNLRYSSPMVHIQFIEEGHQNTNNRRHDRLRETPDQQRQEQKYE
jgi:hypothetical protein